MSAITNTRWADQVTDAIGELIRAEIQYDRAQHSSSAEFANGDDVMRASDKLAELLKDKP